MKGCVIISGFFPLMFITIFCSLPFVRTVNTILKVRLGEYDVSTTAEPLKHEEFNISDIVIHPGFNNSTLVHDIALLRLEKPAKRKQVIGLTILFHGISGCKVWTIYQKNPWSTLVSHKIIKIGIKLSSKNNFIDFWKRRLCNHN